jgi:hypothetical protein
VASSEGLREEGTPKCKFSGGEGVGMDFEDRDPWLGLHEDFRERRKVSFAVLGRYTFRDAFPRGDHSIHTYSSLRMPQMESTDCD